MEAVILAGGQGTRMQNINNKIPKIILEINGKPFLYWLIRQLQKNKVKKIILCLGIKHELILNAIDNYEFKNIDINFFVEKEQLGTGGALISILDMISNDDFIFMNGDSMFNIPIKKLYTTHIQNQNDLTYSLKKLESQNTAYGGISVKSNGQIVSHEMGNSNSKCKLIDAGLRIVNKKTIIKYKNQNNYPISFEKDIAPQFIKTHKSMGLIYDFDFFDIGNPQSYEYTKSNLGKIIN